LTGDASGQATQPTPAERRVTAAGAKPLQSADKPLLFVDIDGVISLFGFASDRRPAGTWVNVDGVLHLLSVTAGGHLLALAQAFDLVWASGWEEKANEHLPLVLGLPAALPFLTFPPRHERPGSHGHWKLESVEAYAGQRALAWIDDDHGDACAAWARAREAPTLLVATDAATGLTDAHVAQLTAWARAPTRQPPDP
jgi:HAD domain in Swiss Army Knife RNA repair proteins